MECSAVVFQFRNDVNVGANITQKSLIPASSWSEELGVEVPGHGSFVQGRVSDE